MDGVFFFDTKGSVVEHSLDAPVYAVKAWERGYYPIYTRLSAADLNKGRYSPEVLEAAQAGSMFGWHVPAAEKAAEFVLASEHAHAAQQIEAQRARKLG